MRRSLVFSLAVSLFLALPVQGQLGSHFSTEEVTRLDTIRKRIEGALERHGSIPGAKKIRDAFKGKLRVTKFVSNVPGGEASVLFSNTEIPEREVQNPIEVVVFDSAHLEHPRIRGKKLFYDGEWRAVFCLDVPFSDEAWFDAFLMHELVHAFHDRAGSASAHALMWSDVWMQEELEAHDLERHVLIRATNGAYEREIRRIIQTANKTVDGSPMVTMEHHVELARLFKQADGLELPLRQTQQLYDILAVWIESTFSVLEWQHQKIILYRFITERS